MGQFRHRFWYAAPHHPWFEGSENLMCDKVSRKYCYSSCYPKIYLVMRCPYLTKLGLQIQAAVTGVECIFLVNQNCNDNYLYSSSPIQFWFSWRYQLPEFSKDYHMVAIDMRGYGETERPPNKSDYTIDLLTQDIVELIPALGHSKCILVAHDWGGAVAW